MKKTSPIQGKTDRGWICLPEWAGSSEFDQAEQCLAALESGVPSILDFSGTTHIDFRALRVFTARIRDLDHIDGPIRITGLNLYCEQILRFALSAEDWDLFELVDGDEMPLGIWEGPEDKGTLTVLKDQSWVPWDPMAHPWAPNLN